MHDWKREQLIGFSIKSFAELERIVGFDIVNMVEIKPEKFSRNGTPLYGYENGIFTPCHDVLERIRSSAISMKIQFHLPIESGRISESRECGLNIGIKDHWNIYLRKFLMFEMIFKEYHMGNILTLHPPLTTLKGKRLIDDDEALKNAKGFFELLDRIRLEKNHATLIGVENQTDPKVLGGNIGFMPGHFRRMLKGTRTIGLTLDTGHRRLTRTTPEKLEFRTRDLLATGIPIVNVHFQGNHARFNAKNFDDDEHLLPDKNNITGYDNHIRWFRRMRPSIVLEISHLERYTDDELVAYVTNLKKELE